MMVDDKEASSEWSEWALSPIMAKYLDWLMLFNKLKVGGKVPSQRPMEGDSAYLCIRVSEIPDAESVPSLLFEGRADPRTS